MVVKDVYSCAFLMQLVKDTGKIRHQVLLVATAESSEGLPPTVRRCFSHEISMGPLTEEHRAEMLSQSLQSGSNLLSNVCGKYKFSVISPYFLVDNYCK